jgi:hypothetical protein
MLLGQPTTTIFLPRPQLWWPVRSAAAAADCCTCQSDRGIIRPQIAQCMMAGPLAQLGVESRSTYAIIKASDMPDLHQQQ